MFLIAVNLVYILSEPIQKLKLWFKWCFAVRKKTNGKALSYSAKRTTTFFKKQLKDIKSFMTSYAPSNDELDAKRKSKIKTQAMLRSERNLVQSNIMDNPDRKIGALSRS